MAVGQGTLIKINPNSQSDTTSDAAKVLEHFSVTLGPVVFDESRTILVFAPAFELEIHGADAVQLYYFNGNGNGNASNAWTQVNVTHKSGNDYCYYHNTNKATSYSDIHVWKIIFNHYAIAWPFDWSQITLQLYGANGVQWQWRKNWTGKPVRAMSVNWWRIDSSGTYTYSDCATCIQQQSPLAQKGQLITWDKNTIANRATNWALESGADRITLCTHQAMDYVTQTGPTDSTVWQDETPAEHEHVWDNGQITRAATCTETGTKTYQCTGCDEHYDETIPALGHDMSGWMTTKNATCGATGTEINICDRCNYQETRTIPATGDHTWIFDRRSGKWDYYHCMNCGETKKVPVGQDEL